MKVQSRDLNSKTKGYGFGYREYEESIGVGKVASGDSLRGILTSPSKLRAGTGKRKDRL